MHIKDVSEETKDKVFGLSTHSFSSVVLFLFTMSYASSWQPSLMMLGKEMVGPTSGANWNSKTAIFKALWENQKPNYLLGEFLDIFQVLVQIAVDLRHFQDMRGVSTLKVLVHGVAVLFFLSACPFSSRIMAMSSRFFFKHLLRRTICSKNLMG